MPLKITIKGPETPQGILNYSSIVQGHSIAAVNAGTIVYKNEMAIDSPFALGTLRQSWEAEPATVSGNVVKGRTVAKGAGGTEANVIDGGATFKSKAPPARNIQPWVRRKLGISDPKKSMTVARRIARKIKSRGLPRRRIFTRVFVAFEGTIDRIMAIMADKIQKDVSS